MSGGIGGRSSCSASSRSLLVIRPMIRRTLAALPSGVVRAAAAAAPARTVEDCRPNSRRRSKPQLDAGDAAQGGARPRASPPSPRRNPRTPRAWSAAGSARRRPDDHGTSKLTGVRKAAILTLLLGEEAASGIFKYLQEDEIERIAREVPRSARAARRRRRVLEEFHQMTVAAELRDARRRRVRPELLTKTLGPAARGASSTASSSRSSRAPASARSAKADPQQLSKFILGRASADDRADPGALERRHAAQLVNLLPDDLRVDVLTRMASWTRSRPKSSAGSRRHRPAPEDARRPEPRAA